MKRVLLSITVLSSLMLWGCPYQSEVPLSPATEKIHEDLLGDWADTDQTNALKPSYYAISMKDSFHYSILDFQFQDDSSGYAVKDYVGHTTQIGDRLFMNVLGNDQKGYYLYRIDMSREGFTLYEVTENIDERFTDSGEMKAFFEKNMELSFFYSKQSGEYISKAEPMK